MKQKKPNQTKTNWYLFHLLDKGLEKAVSRKLMQIIKECMILVGRDGYHTSDSLTWANRKFGFVKSIYFALKCWIISPSPQAKTRGK